MSVDLNLPSLVAHYLEAVKAGDLNGLARCFADDAVVTDVSREIRGLEAIREWARTEIFRIHVRFDVLRVTESDGQTVAALQIDGTFGRNGLPDPLALRHVFEVADGRITRMRIALV
jgi:ketosteroid isomerase-like protein